MCESNQSPNRPTLNASSPQRRVTARQLDPSQTSLLTKTFLISLKAAFRLLEKEIDKLFIEEDAFGLAMKTPDPFKLDASLTQNTRWAFQTDPEKLKLFQQWLKAKFGATVKGKILDALWLKYIEDGFKKGAGRAFEDTKVTEGERPDPTMKSPKLDFYNGTKEEFLRQSFGAPEAIEKVKLLASRTFDGMDGLTAAMTTKMSRILTDGLVQGQNPRTIAKTLKEDLGLSYNRAELIARTEIIRAHAEGQLLAFEKLGVEEVGAAVEWSTAGDNRVCPLCRPLKGIVLKVQEAKGMIPRHPRCRCAWIPANVGETDEGQKATKAKIDAAIKKSAKLGEDSFTSGKPISK